MSQMPATAAAPIARVFVSSTWLDLQPEREAVERAIHRLRETKFVGMEYFGSRDETTQRASLDEVDRSEVYVGLFAGRYGSGITEDEYRRARERELPCFVYGKAPDVIPAEWRETDPTQTAKLRALLKDLRRDHTLSDFRTPDELAAKVTDDLHRWLVEEFLDPRLARAARGEMRRAETEQLLAAIKDVSDLNQELLKKLQTKGYIIAKGDRSVAAGSITGSMVITGDHNTTAQGRGSGSVAVGERPVAAGAGSVAIGGDVYGDISVDSGQKRRQERDALISAYLDSLCSACTGLRLTGVDQGTAQTGKKPLELGQVYVDLDVDLQIPKALSLAKWWASKEQRTRAKGPEESAREEQRRVPLLEALGLHRELVLLGAPGSGKSTFVAYVALSLAQGWLDHAQLENRLGSWWQAGPLLPVRVVLRHFAAFLPADAERGRAADVWSFLQQELINSGQGEEVFAALREAVRESGAVFLLDGLDEARDAQTRSRLLEAVTEFVQQAGAKSRFLLTSRPYAWRDVEEAARSASNPAAVAANGYPRYTLAEFDEPQTDLFIQRWFEAIRNAGWISQPEAAEKTTNLQAAVRFEEYGRLARNPLLLTLMATLLANQMRLPDDRTDLYDQVVDLLLRRWNESIGMDRGLLHALQVPSLKLSDVRGALEGVAYEAHAAHQGKDGVADIAEGQLIAALRPMLEDRADKAERVLDYIEQRSGLLLSQGPRKGLRQYTFPHRTFQEFLSGCHLKDRDDFTEVNERLAEEAPGHWREVLRFAARLAGPHRGVTGADALVHAQEVELWRQKHALRDRDWERAVLAGEQVLEIGLAAVIRQERQRTIKDRVVGWLAALVSEGHLPPPQRALAGVVLGSLGDARPGVGLTKGGLPDIEWLGIEPGPFRYGDGEDREVCEAITQRYGISKYPVTVGQYGAFVAAGGYGEERYWTKAGWAWRWQENVEGPEEYGAELQVNNHPQVGVSWYEGVAFCRWLGERLGRAVSLPSEWEWERAARGTKGREYPWGDEEENYAQRCNMRETGIGHTSAVGMFPSGDAECGASDMAGNVWEWCRTDHNKPEQESLVGDAVRVLRGGSWHYSRAGGRSSLRVRSNPDVRYYNIGFRVVVSPF